MKMIPELILAPRRRKKLAPQRPRKTEKVRKWESGRKFTVSPSHRLTFPLPFLCLYLIFLCLFSPRFSHAAEDDAVALYNQAGKAYEAEQYEEAVALYEKITKMGIQDGRVFYNLGNAYFKAGQLGKAILYYERARRLLPRDEDIEANLRFVRLLKVDKEPPEERNVVVRFVLNLYDAFSLNGLAKAASGLYILMMLSGIGWILYGRRFRSIFASILIILGAVFVPVFGALAFKIHAEVFVKEAIVISDEVDARSGPGAGHTKIFAVHEGTKVRLERRDGDWALVRLNSGIRGWIEGKGMEEI
ncbi:MAG: hypothetical protein B1H02_04400 [Candidatus Latescibacteria bacterium 4484_107]|nr:MAG: hypothetical protein B1H02_04400 [Candidatus Latescibacteria bacterium 4484_107]